MKYLLGLDIGGTNLKGGVVSPAGEMIVCRSRPSFLSAGWMGLVTQAEKLLTDLVKEIGLSLDEVQGLGVGVPGTVRLPEGEVAFSPNLKWAKVPLLAALRARFNLPVRVDNDAHVAALGEYWRGTGRGFNAVLMLTVGTGIGSGLLLGGSVFRGRSGLGIEMGHMVIDPDGPACGCGNRGCLEALTAAPALKRLGRELLASGRESALSGDDRAWEVRDIFTAAASGDKVSQEVVAHFIKYLSVGLSNAVVMLDPDVILLGGGVTDGAQVFLSELSHQVAVRVNHMAYPPPAILPAVLGNNAGIIGAAYLAAGNGGGGR